MRPDDKALLVMVLFCVVLVYGGFWAAGGF